jgi:hypothetical protein
MERREEESDFELGDVESFQSEKNEAFSHSALVMSIMRKCLDAGSSEMKAGYWQQKSDKQGNLISTYIEDTRRKFISSVMTAIGIMICDFDKEAEDNIKLLIEEIETKKKEIAEENDKIWENSAPEFKKQNPHVKGFITLSFLQDLMTENQLEIYRDIFAELSKLTSRKNFYKAEMFEG